MSSHLKGQWCNKELNFGISKAWAGTLIKRLPFSSASCAWARMVQSQQNKPRKRNCFSAFFLIFFVIKWTQQNSKKQVRYMPSLAAVITLCADRIWHRAGIAQTLRVDSSHHKQINRIGPESSDSVECCLYMISHCLPAIAHRLAAIKTQL